MSVLSAALGPWHPHPDVWLLLGVLAGGYCYALRRVGPGHVHPIERTATRSQVTLFMLGVLSMWFAADWPLHDLSERYLYSAHMLQHMVLSLVAPPLLLLGTPDWLVRALLFGPLMRAARFASRPFYALVGFNVVIVLTHWPLVVDAALRSEPVHFGTHAVLFAAALAMWMPVLSPVLEIPRLPYPGQMVYLFLQSLVPTVPASFLTFSDHVIYRFYEAAPRLWGVSAATDQKVAGLMMKIVGGFLLWGVIAVLFFKWYGREQREGMDVLRWHSVDRELNKVALTGVRAGRHRDHGTPPAGGAT